MPSAGCPVTRSCFVTGRPAWRPLRRASDVRLAYWEWFRCLDGSRMGRMAAWNWAGFPFLSSLPCSRPSSIVASGYFRFCARWGGKGYSATRDSGSRVFSALDQPETACASPRAERTGVVRWLLCCRNSRLRCMVDLRSASKPLGPQKDVEHINMPGHD